MIVAFFLLTAGVALLYVGGDWLVRGSVSVAARHGISTLVIGLTVVAFGTSSPELAVSVTAAVAGRGTLAVGNVVGSNICNIALILGLAAVVRPVNVQAQLVRRDVPIMIVCALVLVGFLANGILSRLEGSIFLAGIVVYTVLQLRWDRGARNPGPDVAPEAAADRPRGGGGWWAIGLGLVALTAGANVFVRGAVALATILDVGQAFVAVTVVAVGTSLPELATTVVASARSESDIAAGNIVGSNVFNILAILGITAVLHPLSTGGLHRGDLVAMTVLAVAMLPLARTGFRLSRWEGVVLLASYVGYVWWRYSISGSSGAP